MASSSPDAIIIVSPSNNLYVKGALQYDMLFATTCNIQSICFGYSNMYMKIASNGNVGIGTSNPNALLDVAGSVNVQSNLICNKYIGIGLSNPTYALDVAGNVNLRSNTTLQSNLYVYGSTILYNPLQVIGSNVTINPTAGFDVDKSTYFITSTAGTGVAAAGSTIGYFGISNTGVANVNNVVINTQSPSNNSSILFKNNGVENMRVNSNGYIGIGTLTPANSLDVAGSVNIRSNMTIFGNLTVCNTEYVSIEYISNNQIIQNNLAVYQMSTLCNAVNIYGATAISNNLNISGDINTNATIRSVTHSNSGSMQVGGWIYGLNSALATAANNLITCGKALSPNNTTNYRYTHRGGDGSTNNYVGIGFWGNDDILNVVATGNVGVGTASPSYKLDVNGDINTNATIRSVTHSNSGNMQIGGNTYFSGAFGGVNNAIITGTGDGGIITTYNVAFKSHWGIGFPSHDGLNRITIDTRNGNISSSGTIYAAFSGNVTGNCTGNAATASLLNGNDNGSSFEINKWYRDNSGRADSHRFYFENGGRTYLSSPSGRFDFGTTASTTGVIYCGTINTGAISCTSINTNGNTITGPLTGNVTGNCSGNAATATSAARLTGNAYTNGTDGFFRSKGQTGWYSDDYAVGIYANEASWVHTYNNSGLKISGANGVMFDSYGGGFYMADSIWLRTYGDKSIWAGSGNICCNGSMGVGTSAPNYKLDVQGNGRFTGNLLINNCQIYYPTSYTAFGNSDYQNGWCGWAADNRLYFMTAANNTGGIYNRPEGKWILNYNGSTVTSDYTFSVNITGSAGSCSGNSATATSAGYANSAGSAGSAGGLYGNPDISVSSVIIPSGTPCYISTHPYVGGAKQSYGYGDAASFTANNLNIQSWQGIGFPTYDGTNKIFFDCRNGNICTNGKIGIGTALPAGPLHIIASGNSTTENGIFCQNLNNYAGQDAILSLAVAGSSAGNPYIGFDISYQAGWSLGVDNNDSDKFKICCAWGFPGSTKMTIDRDGKVGIGTTSPSYPLHISGNSISYNAPWGTGYLPFNSTSWKYEGGDLYRNVSIRADEAVVANAFLAVSDMRVKTNIICNEPLISKVNQLKPCTFSYIDIVEKGNSSKYGFIAQEVEDLFPTCVSKIKDYIPDIFTVATAKNISEDTYMITIPKISLNLKEKDNLQIIINEKNIKETFDILTSVETSDSTKITIISKEKFDDQVFVIGRKVNDFRILNYEQLTTVAISAIQELVQINKKLEDRIELLEKLYKDIARKIE